MFSYMSLSSGSGLGSYKVVVKLLPGAKVLCSLVLTLILNGLSFCADWIHSIDVPLDY
jgi:hypothetical protein